MLLILLLGIADFGRVFQAGITMEAAARNAAEAAAQEYVQLIRNRPGGVLDSGDYQRLHDIALEKVCDEAAVLPNRVPATGVGCDMPSTAVCVHLPDGSPDPAGCGTVGGAAAPAECVAVNGTWQTGNDGYVPAGSTALPSVEVRTCYRFTTLFNLSQLQLPLGWSLSIGDIYLERDRDFTVACYPQATGPCT
jgi:hypothetical protein